MVLKNDPRAVLDLLGASQEKRDARNDDDEFLDKLEKKTDFKNFPSKAPSDLKVRPLNNEMEEKMLRGSLDDDEEEEESKLGWKAYINPVDENNPVRRRFLALFSKPNRQDTQASVSESADLDKAAKAAITEQQELPRVGDTEEEKLAKQEDKERRQAWIEHEQEKEGKETDKYKESHQKFVAIFDDVHSKE